MRLAGRVAIVTGSSRGIGKAIALTLAREGCDVVVAAKSVHSRESLPGSIHETAEEIGRLGRRALAIRCDLRQAEQIDALVAQTLEQMGRIDLLVNNAGTLWTGKSVLETPSRRLDHLVDVNIAGSFNACRAVLPTMLERGSGHIVNVSPPIDYEVLPGRVAYLMTKYAMTMLTMGLAEEVRAHGIGVYSLWPRTLIESQATIAWEFGEPKDWRKAEILGDAVVALATSEEVGARTGKAWIDEDVLREDGVTDFSKYDCVPGGEPVILEWPRYEGIPKS